MEEEKKPRTPFFKMSPLKKEGYCIKCNVIFMAGTQPLMHRFTKAMYCDGCAQGYVDSKAGEVKTTSIKDESIHKRLNAIEKNQKQILKLLEAIAESLDIHLEDNEDEIKPVKENLPKPACTINYLWESIHGESFRAMRGEETVEIKHDEKGVYVSSVTIAHQMKAAAISAGYKIFGWFDNKWTQVG